MEKIRAVLSRLLVLPFLLLAVAVHAGDLDIRTSGALLEGQFEVGYTAAIGRCDEVAAIKAGSHGDLREFSSRDVRRSVEHPNTCFVDFSVSGGGKHQPRLTVTRNSGDTVTHSESFSPEQNAPQVALEGVDIVGEKGEQELVVKITASDDTDVSYVAVDLAGLRASDIRHAGGVLAEARKQAFASTGGVKRSFPVSDSQSLYTVSVPVDDPLSRNAIARDAIISIDAYAVDASGNQRSVSDLALTGDSIEESANKLIVSDEPIVINNALQTPVIKPSVEFEFRGVVDVSGRGRNVSYESSHPDIVSVTSGGVLFPLQESGDENVTIDVSYGNLDPVTIPVQVDFSKELVGLEFEGIPSGALFELEALNRYQSLPPLVGVFDDGERTQLSSTWTPVLSIPEAYSGFLKKNTKGDIKSSAVIPESSPAGINVKIAELPSVETKLQVTAVDGPPSLELELPSSVEAPGELLLKATASDDVGVDRVVFEMDGASIGDRESAPYEVTLPLNEGMEGRTLDLSARVVDTSGQETRAPAQSVEVVAESEPEVPEFEFELPTDGYRAVEDTPLQMQVASSLGSVESPQSRSGIQYVEFFFDGDKVGEAKFPVVEKRTVGDRETLHELWRFKGNLPDIAVEETTLSVSVRVHGPEDATEDAPAKLVRVSRNTRPDVSIVEPEPGTSVTVGQTLPVTVEARDDTLSLGTDLEFHANSTELAAHRLVNDGVREEGSIQRWTFSYEPEEEDLGETVKLQVKATDAHQEVGHSEVLEVTVQGDQPPTVAIANPSEGASFVSGLPIPIRANAVDDLDVQKVDFFVNDRLVGADNAEPFAYSYDTPENIETEQTLEVHAVATDSAGQTAESQTVEVTLGNDEEAPVANLVSPEITATQSGKDVAPVIEDSEFVLKVAGYDNVAATRVELKGVRKDGDDYVLTGLETDVLKGSEFPIEDIPGKLNSYSALRLVSAPAFSGIDGIPYDTYPITVDVYDEVGNRSRVEAIIGVAPDEPPTVSSAVTDMPAYFPRDSVQTEIAVKDDRAVSRVDVEYKLDGQPLETLTRDTDNGLTPGEIVQTSTTLDLADHALPNQEQTLTLVVTGYDQNGQSSEPFETSVTIRKDDVKPQASIYDPSPGTLLYAGETVPLKWKARDNTGLASVEVRREDTGELLKRYSLSDAQADETVGFTVHRWSPEPPAQRRD